MLALLLLLPFLANASPLDGAWYTSCAQNVIREEKFQDTTVSLFEKNFKDAFCAVPSLEIESMGSFELDAISLPKYHAIDFHFQTVFLTLHSVEAVSFYNRSGMCGFSDWALDARREITGLACDFFATGSPVHVPKQNDGRFGIYELSGEQLFFGALTPWQNGLSESTRPTTLELNPYWKLAE